MIKKSVQEEQEQQSFFKVSQGSFANACAIRFHGLCGILWRSVVVNSQQRRCLFSPAQPEPRDHNSSAHHFCTQHNTQQNSWMKRTAASVSKVPAKRLLEISDTMDVSKLDREQQMDESIELRRSYIAWATLCPLGLNIRKAFNFECAHLYCGVIWDPSSKTSIRMRLLVKSWFSKN